MYKREEIAEQHKRFRQIITGERIAKRSKNVILIDSSSNSSGNSSNNNGSNNDNNNNDGNVLWLSEGENINGIHKYLKVIK